MYQRQGGQQDQGSDLALVRPHLEHSAVLDASLQEGHEGAGMYPGKGNEDGEGSGAQAG